jgi:hypothetical protein
MAKTIGIRERTTAPLGREGLLKKDMTFTGKLRTDIDPMLLSPGDFRQLVNMRYLEKGVQGVLGMTKINASAAAYTRIDNGFHFRKGTPRATQPMEDHILVQTTNAAGTLSRIVKSDTIANVPLADTFSTILALTDTGQVRFSDAPNGTMMVMDGHSNYIWGGNEDYCNSFIVFDPDNTYWYDYTNQVNNTLDDAKNLATMHRKSSTGVDAYTMLLLHGDNNITDSSPTTAHTVSQFGWADDDIYDGGFSSLTGWTDGDAGSGSSTATTFSGRSTFKFDSGGVAGVGNYAERSQDIGTLGVTFAVTLVSYFETVGTVAAGNHFKMTVDNGEITLDVAFGSDGLFVYDGAVYNEVGTNIVVADKWQEFTFVVDATTAASANCSVYLDDVLVDATNDCSNVVTATDGLVALRQTGTTVTNSMTYTDILHVGTTQKTLTYSTTRQFGTHSISLPGDHDHCCLTILDNADFDFSDGIFTVDGWVYLTIGGLEEPIYYQGTDDTNYFMIYRSTSSDHCLVASLMIAGVEQLTGFKSPPDTLPTMGWHHIEVSENGNTWYMFINGALVTTVTTASRCADYTGVVKIGGSNATFGTTTFGGLIDELRVSNNCRHTANFSVPLASYGTVAATYLYIGATRPIQGVKFYVKHPNATGGTVSGYYWSGSSWTTVGTITDSTDSPAGTSLAIDGSLSFTSTVGLARAKFIKDRFAYFYQFVFTDLDADTTIYYCTLDMPIQPVVDIWDGAPRPIASFFKHTTTYIDLGTNVLKEEYLSTDPSTYAQVGGLTAAQELYVGFNQRMSGFTLNFPDDSYINAVANTVMEVYYWSGTAWTTVGVIDDGTSTGAISMKQTGTVTWNAKDIGTEYQTNISTPFQYNYYKVVFNNTLTADVRIDVIDGLPAQNNIGTYRFSSNWQNRLWMFDEQSNRRDQALVSAYGTNCVFNGDDSAKITFGDNSEVVATGTLFTRYGGGLYDNMIVLKTNAAYLIDGTGPSTWKIYTVSDNVGCLAPLSLQKCDISYDVAPGIAKHVLIWLSSRGVESFDGNTMGVISGDIGSYFDSSSSDYVNVSMLSSAVSFYDQVNTEYHLLISTGSNTYLDTELVYALRFKKWYVIDRGTTTATKRLNCAWTVMKSNGYNYNYGGTRDGFIERLEYGTSFDGDAIAHTLHTGDFPLIDTLEYVTEVRHIKITGVSKNSTSNTISVTYYLDGDITGTTLTPLACSSSSRLYQKKVSVGKKGILHGMKFTISTSNETIGFEPLALSVLCRMIREDL